MLRSDTMFTIDPENKYLSYPCVYPKDYILKSEGERCNEIGLILSGHIEMLHYFESGDVSTLASLKTGDFFGDVLIFSDMPFYIGHLIAKTDVEITFLSKENLKALIDEDASFRQSFIENIAHKASLFNIRNKLLQQPTLKDKILFYLDFEALRQNNAYVTLESIQAWAIELNVARPSLSRTLKELENDGQIERLGKTFKVNHSCTI